MGLPLVAAGLAPAAAPSLFTKGGLATAATVAGAAISAVDAIQSGRAEQQRADLQADIERQKAKRELENAAVREEDLRRKTSQLMGQRRAILGASGVDPSSGSPLLVSEDFAAEAELQALRIRSGGELSATRLEQQANLFRLSGRQAGRAGFVRGGALLLDRTGSAFRSFG